MKKTVLITSFLALTFAATLTPAQAQNAAALANKYIVSLHEGVNPAEVAITHGAAAEYIYSDALNGFAGTVPPGRLKALLRDPRVKNVEQDVVVGLVQPAVEQTSTGPIMQGEGLPTGVNRVDADFNTFTDASSVGVAVLDTGISLKHPDLNVAGSISFIKGKRSAEDDNGHGSHVAGVIGAKLNGSGIRGVAPNARLYAVKVLDYSGSGSLSAIVSGIDWVTKNAATKNIKVANLSLGFQGTSATLNSAISKSIAAGVTYIVAAGNSAMDAANFSPANHPQVITVSAFVDSDGACGWKGAGTGYGADDTFASFSNFGSVVDIAAPGVNIYSTYLNGGYATMSGTSMASPHVAGAAALYLINHVGASPSAVFNGLLAEAVPQNMPLTIEGNRTIGGFTGDRDSYREPVLDAFKF